MLRPFRGVRPRLGERVWVDPCAVVIGDVVLGDDASVWPQASIRGDMGRRIRIGPRTSVQDNCTLHITHDGPYSPGGSDLLIGADVTIGHGAILHACTVGNGCLVGMGSILLDQVLLEDGCMLAAGSVVPPGRRLQSGWLYRGSPAIAVRALTAGERDRLSYMAANYVRLKDEYLAGAS